jgi:hypothetical protein
MRLAALAVSAGPRGRALGATVADQPSRSAACRDDFEGGARLSELLDRILGEIRERLAASRAAVLEHERLDAALHALGGRLDDQPAGTHDAKASSAAVAEPSAATPTNAVGATSAEATRRSRAPRARGRARSRPKAGRGAPARQRAPRGANREAVLRVVEERPGASAREIATVSGVSGGTLYALLRTLIERGELEKRALPGGQSGYALAPSPTDADPPAPTSTPASSEASSPASPAPAPLDSTEAHDGISPPAAGASPETDVQTRSGQPLANEAER